MAVGVFRISFSSDVPLDEAEMTLQLASFAAEGLFGRARVRLDFGYFVDAPRSTILVDGSTEVGAAIVQVFVGLLLREIAEESFRVERMQAQQHHPQEAAA